jgi:hypothetical protein
MADTARPTWTDHDVHDPGITRLQAVVYAVGAAGLVVASVAFIRSRRDTGGSDPD